MLQDTSLALLGALGAAGFLLVLYHFGKPRKTASLPPGRKVFQYWAMPQTTRKPKTTTLNDVAYATEMLDKKSRIYSDRPTLIMGGELWSEYRRLMAQVIGTRAKVETSYRQILEERTHDFLRNILLRPDAWPEHAQSFSATLVLAIAFGYKAKDEDDPLLKLADETMAQFTELLTPSAFAVDVFPLLRFVPEWFPGASWKKKVKPYRQTLQDLLDTPFAWVREQMKAGTSIPCAVSEMLESSSSDKQSIKWAAAVVYGGGSETVRFAYQAQRKAQEELQHVLGQGVAPRLDDRSSLPYLEAFLLEILRTYTTGPVGASSPHVVTEDDVHNGFFMPKGSIILPNNWLFFRDSNTYPNPETFSPERFIETPTHAKEKEPEQRLDAGSPQLLHL
ncbi:cytochrome P450 [Mycena metata]|uniref:Cytochrome P450 n=1 Tax=Mycena metata TaxID=1033252 RepID=A0AAD7J5N0_9AGAR|nr:cytochrome P450 [Mycena metata]